MRNHRAQQHQAITLRWRKFISASALVTAACAAPSLARVPTISANDNRSPMTTEQVGDTVVVHLIARRGRWFPAGESDSSLAVAAFSSRDGAPSIPGPLVRIASGSFVRFDVRNDTPDTLALCPMASLSCKREFAVLLHPGKSGGLAAARLESGAHLYRAGIVRQGLVLQFGGGGMLSGALMVDSAPPDARDRLLVLNGWLDTDDTTRFVQSINGRTWPATERLSAAVGDTIRWRILNATVIEHPMHLHGFFFRVESHGDIVRDTSFAADARELAVTENLLAWGVATIAWAPSRAGNWLFHCHKTAHMSSDQLAALHGVKPGAATVHLNGAEHLAHDMGGLILGVNVEGDPRADAPLTTPPSRRLRLEITERPKFYRGATAYAFRLASDSRVALGAASEGIPGPLFALQRGQPVEIAIINRSRVASTVHWHGIELESFYDGVAGWSGVPGSLTSMLAPSDSFVARFTPPRSGSFMYHAHVNETAQIPSGLYAPLVVTDDGLLPSHDHVLLFSQNGPDDLAKVAVNGHDDPDTLQLRAGVSERLRLINITGNDDVSGELMSGGQRASWRRVARDGATLPVLRQGESAARFHFGPGEILDVAVTLQRGVHRLHIRSFNDFDIPIVVR